MELKIPNQTAMAAFTRRINEILWETREWPDSIVSSLCHHLALSRDEPLILLNAWFYAILTQKGWAAKSGPYLSRMMEQLEKGDPLGKG